MKTIRDFFSTLRRDAAVEAAKLTLSLIGVGTILGDFAVMRLWLLLPAALLLCATWLVIYGQCQ